MLGTHDREEPSSDDEHKREIDALAETRVGFSPGTHSASPKNAQDETSNTLEICTLCRGINITALAASGRCEHAQTVDILEDCTSKCVICRDIFGKILAQEWAVYAKSEEFHIEKGLCLKLERQDCKDEFPGSFLGVYFNSDRLIYETEVFTLRTLKDDPAIDYEVIPNSEGGSALEQFFALARDWIGFCKSNHECSRALPFLDGVDKVPSMLIDVRKFPADVCLVEIKPDERLPEYVALSHCWGPDGLQKDAKTTAASLESQMERIPFSSLPLNFQRAIRITRELDIPYLWIDALCIIQDSPNHWDREVIKMGAIYSNAMVSIAATSSEDSNSGCLSLADCRLDSTLNELEVEIKNALPNGTQSSLFLRIRLNRGHKFYPLYNPLSDSPLAKRAWTFQERILSPRMLQYTKDGLIWECSKGYRTIDGICNPTARHHSNTMTVCGLGRELGSSTSRTDLNYWILDLWYSQITENYSKRKLTIFSDKPPAIASIARAVNWQTAAVYLAGIWSKKLAWGLAWARSNDWKEPDVGPKPQEDRGPSWSWVTHDFASVWSKPWENNRKDFTSCVSLEDSRTELSGPDPFGRVSTGWLRITGPLKRGFLALHAPEADEELGRGHARQVRRNPHRQS